MMERLTVLAALALGACISQETQRVNLVAYQPVVLEVTNPETTDEDLYAAAVWILGDSVATSFRDDKTRVIKTAFEYVGIRVTKVNEEAFARAVSIYHRLVVRPVEGQLWVFVDCVAADRTDLYRLRVDRCGSKKRESGWQELATKAAKFIVEDADYRAQRRAERAKKP